jgi:hypothetical protein
MSKFFKDIFTGTSNLSYEISRTLWAAGILALIVYAGVHLVLHAAFDAIEFGTGLGIALAGGGVATAAKDFAHPANRTPATVVEGDMNAPVAGDMNVGGKP